MIFSSFSFTPHKSKKYRMAHDFEQLPVWLFAAEVNGGLGETCKSTVDPCCGVKYARGGLQSCHSPHFCWWGHRCMVCNVAQSWRQSSLISKKAFRKKKKKVMSLFTKHLKAARHILEFGLSCGSCTKAFSIWFDLVIDLLVAVWLIFCILNLQKCKQD